MNTSKPVLSFENLIKKIEEKNIIVKDIDKAKKILERINYQRLLVYRLHFIKSKKETKIVFNDIYKLYLFDKELKTLFYPILESIEFTLRAKIAYHLGIVLGVHCHLDLDNFNQTEQHEKLLDMLKWKLDPDNYSRHQIIKYHQEKYDDDVPIYKIVEILTLGQLSKLFSNIKSKEIQSEILKSFKRKEHKLNIKTISSWFKTITDVRNICAHHELLWNRKYEPVAIRNKVWKDSISFRNKDKEVYSIFAIFLICKILMLDRDSFQIFISSFNDLIQSYSDIIQLSDLGFPDNWIEILLSESK